MLKTVTCFIIAWDVMGGLNSGHIAADDNTDRYEAVTNYFGWNAHCRIVLEQRPQSLSTGVRSIQVLLSVNTVIRLSL